KIVVPRPEGEGRPGLRRFLPDAGNVEIDLPGPLQQQRPFVVFPPEQHIAVHVHRLLVGQPELPVFGQLSDCHRNPSLREWTSGLPFAAVCHLFLIPGANTCLNFIIVQFSSQRKRKHCRTQKKAVWAPGAAAAGIIPRPPPHHPLTARPSTASIASASASDGVGWGWIARPTSLGTASSSRASAASPIMSVTCGTIM